jgi:hypothetical protein
MIGWGCDRGGDDRLRRNGNRGARLGARPTTTGALAVSGGPYFENIILTGKRITTNLGSIRDPGHTEPRILAMAAKPGYLTTLGYAARRGIKPMLSDFKSRGSGLQHTHLRYPDRLARLILLIALALYGAVSTGRGDPANNPAPAKKPPDRQPAKLARGRLSWLTRGLRRALKPLLQCRPLPKLWRGLIN